MSNFSAIWRLSPLSVTGLQILAYARRSGPLSREGSFSCHTCCDTGPRLIRSRPKDRYSSPTVGFKPSTQVSSDHCARPFNHCATQAEKMHLLYGAKFLCHISKRYLWPWLCWQDAKLSCLLQRASKGPHIV
jgi:hypothetical protein